MSGEDEVKGHGLYRASGVLYFEKVKNELKWLFRLVNMRSSTIGGALWYYYTMDKRVQAYIWGIAHSSTTGQRVLDMFTL